MGPPSAPLGEPRAQSEGLEEDRSFHLILTPLCEAGIEPTLRLVDEKMRHRELQLLGQAHTAASVVKLGLEPRQSASGACTLKPACSCEDSEVLQRPPVSTRWGSPHP